MFTTNLSALYRSVLFKRGFKFAFLLLGKMLSFAMFKKVFETLFYPDRMKRMNFPSAELLSIVVAQKTRCQGIAKRLIEKGFEECSKIGIENVKVMVGAGNEPANRLYSKCGFELAIRINNHGVLSNIYVAKTSLGNANES